jgi:hypothetical protein
LPSDHHEIYKRVVPHVLNTEYHIPDGSIETENRDIDTERPDVLVANNKFTVGFAVEIETDPSSVSKRKAHTMRDYVVVVPNPRARQMPYGAIYEDIWFQIDAFVVSMTHREILKKKIQKRVEDYKEREKAREREEG